MSLGASGSVLWFEVCHIKATAKAAKLVGELVKDRRPAGLTDLCLRAALGACGGRLKGQQCLDNSSSVADGAGNPGQRPHLGLLFNGPTQGAAGSYTGRSC